MGGGNAVFAAHSVSNTIPIFFPIKGIDIKDDNTKTFEGTWNADETIKTVTRATASGLSNSSGYDLIVWPLSAITWIDGTPLNLTKNDVGVRVETNNTHMHFGNYSKCQSDSVYGAGYWFGAARTVNGSSCDITSTPSEILANPALLNGTYQIYITFKYQGKTYTCKKTLIIAY